jgi:Zn-dependent M28 family amino/carboxypeptidase
MGHGDGGRTGASADRLREHVAALAGRIGERHLWRPLALRAAEQFIAAEWQAMGYAVAPQVYHVRGLPCANLEISRRGRTRPDEILLLGAHYDSVLGSPGANDNGSGVAALLELSRLLAGARSARTVRLVAFVNEEPPLFLTQEMGSHVYARAARARGDDVRLMLSLETIGYYRDEPGTQRYPPPLGLCYPDPANFVALVSDLGSRRALRRVFDAFRAHSDFPVQRLAAPGLLPGVAWSDHRSFRVQGYPALMVTDTAFYRDPCYHTPEDLPERLAYEALARVVDGLFGAVLDLAAAG